MNAARTVITCFNTAGEETFFADLVLGRGGMEGQVRVNGLSAAVKEITFTAGIKRPAELVLTMLPELSQRRTEPETTT